MTVVAGVVVVVWWWWLNEKNVGAVWFVGGDMACHVISVGNCCLNMHMHLWASSSVVKHMLTVPAKVRGSNPAGNAFIL